MGRISKKNILSGKVANLVYRELDGRQIVQIHPGSISQTKATQASGSEFRQCSRWAKQLRLGLHAFLEDQTDSYMYRRLTGVMYNTLLSNTHLPKGQRTPVEADMSNLVGFDFNSHTPFKEYFTPGITVMMDAQRQLQITIPPFEPKSQMLFPQEASNAELVLIVHATSFETNTPIVDYFFTLPIERHAVFANETVWSIPPIPEGYFVVVATKLLYFSFSKFMGKKYSNSKSFNPASIIFCGH